jgi:hypothetical protein
MKSKLVLEVVAFHKISVPSNAINLSGPRDKIGRRLMLLARHSLANGRPSGRMEVAGAWLKSDEGETLLYEV